MRLIDIDDDRNCYCGECGEYERWNIDPDVLAEAQTTQTNTDSTQNNALERVKGFPIDADLLMIKVLKEYGIMAHDRLYHIIETMDKYELPSAQRKTGKWIEKEYSPFYCSVCGTYQYSASWEIKNKEYNFCPNCGADMRGENV